MKRVYVLEYSIITNLFSSSEPNREFRREYYSKFERDEFMQRYKELKEKYYIEDLIGYFGELQEVDVEAMAKVI